MLIASKEIKAVIFDLDGTLIDSSNIWSEIDKAFFAKRGMEIPPTYVDDIAHIGLKEAAINYSPGSQYPCFKIAEV